MAETRGDIDGVKYVHPQKRQDNDESIDDKLSPEKDDAGNHPNQVSNGTQDTPRESGIARVGNTSPGEEEQH